MKVELAREDDEPRNKGRNCVVWRWAQDGNPTRLYSSGPGAMCEGDWLRIDGVEFE